MRGNAERVLGRTPAEWFAEAVRWYLEGHQACPCCRHRHCVFRSQWGTRIEYHCTSCDFSVAQDAASHRCTATRGEGLHGPGVLLGLEPVI
jgi:hypothetical protein